MPEQQGVSFITTMGNLKQVRDDIWQRDSRCVGYLNREEAAIKAVKENAGDIHEDGAYPLCVVETLGEGIYPYPISTHWFEWQQDKGGYQEIPEPPEDLARVIGFSIG